MAATDMTDLRPGAAERWRALVAAAMALPGLAAQAADAGVRNEQTVVSYHHGQYDESGDRMSVRVDQLSVSVPVGNRWSVRLNTTRDITSGASIFSYIGVRGSPQIIRTGATIHDQRSVFDATAAWYGDDDQAEVTVGHSGENDYRANYVNLGWRRSFNEKATTLSLGAGYSNDTTWEKYYPLQIGSVPEVYRKRRSQTLLLGLTQIMDAQTVVQFNLGRIEHRGFLDDQYRRPAVMVGFVPTFVAENRPARNQWTAVARWSRYLKDLHSALHLDYRYGKDSWGADSHTVEAKWRWELAPGWVLSPGVRSYRQKSADFYDVYFTAAPANGRASSDNRLASFKSTSGKLELVKTFGSGSLVRVSAEQLDRRKGSGRGTTLDDLRARTVSTSLEFAF